MGFPIGRLAQVRMLDMLKVHLQAMWTLAGSCRQHHPWGAHIDSRLNRIRDTELWLIALHSCVLNTCVESYCISEMDPMTKSHVTHLRIIRCSRQKCPHDLSNHLFLCWDVSLKPRLQAAGLRECGSPWSGASKRNIRHSNHMNEKCFLTYHVIFPHKLLSFIHPSFWKSTSKISAAAPLQCNEWNFICG